MADLLSLLWEHKALSASTMAVVRKFCTRWEVTGFHALLETHVFEESQLADTLARILQMDRVYKLGSQEMGAVARGLIPFEFAVRWECLPNFVHETGQLEVVLADPVDCPWQDQLRQLAGCPVHFTIGTYSEIMRAIADYYSLPEQLPFLRQPGFRSPGP